MYDAQRKKTGASAAQPERGVSPSLLERARRGEAAAFEELYQTLFTPVYRYVIARVGDRSLADDITQTTFLKAYQAVSRFEERGIEPLAYLLTIARNTIIDHWKKRKEVLESDTEPAVGNEASERPEPQDPSSDVASEADRVTLRDDLRAALLILTAEQRDVLSLRFFAERTTEEIAEALQKSPEAIRQLQSRALKILRTELKDAPWITAP